VEQLQSAFEPYRHLDPLGWVGVFRFIPVYGGLIAVVLGVLMMLFGGRQLFRMVAGPLGALIAMVWAVPLAQRMGFGANLRQVSVVAPIALFITGLAWPPAVVFFAFGIPAGLIGGQIAGNNDWILGFGPGFFVGGAIGVVMHRLVGAILSAAAGAWLTVLGLLAVMNPFISAAGWLANSPVAVLSVAGCFAIAGAVFQIFVRPSEEQAASDKIERTLAKKKAKEQKALEERWEKYNNSKK
jgi:hypothetical protein